jgi:hypothetical protein
MSRLDRTAADEVADGPREPRIAILVLGCLLPVYDRCIRTIRATWGSRRSADVDIYYMYGGQSTGIDPEAGRIDDLIGRSPPELGDLDAWVTGDIMVCGAGDVYAEQHDCILRKRLAAFGYVARRQQYDFAYTVCASSYVDVDALLRYVGSLPATGVYHGPLGVYAPTGYPYVSGASILLSTDVAADLSDNAQAIISANADGKADDVVIGHWIADRHCAESPAVISGRIAVAQRPTANQCFVLPNGNGLINFVESPAHAHAPQASAYHYHFHSRRMWEMEAFHRRYFAA